MSNIAELQPILDNWREWPLAISAPPKIIGPILGGRTNRSIQIELPGIPEPIILRLNNRHSNALGIDRGAEAKILMCAANAGIAPAPLYQDPAQRFSLLPYLQARVWSHAELAQPQQRQRLFALLQQVRELKPATVTRSYHAYLSHYWQQLHTAKITDHTLTQLWAEFEPRLRQFDQQPWPRQLTHHDLIPENILDTGEHLYLIDWEYAALGHPEIDLWSIDPSLVQEPFIAELAHWTNLLWERVLTLPRSTTTA
ncbi:choline/ethanolamine kinase family protein [Gilvimarinus polysaccharolyticus]|uniref:choline/ethanolamine kinase family protein n=1 Tax=Gilvimarinus polysaccharolyticus TaxID=863921 RepID=UPI0006736D18|nr:choline/ethanolamine kinase family protein [Gilvimarinus polysaccharolyticus]